MIGEVLLYEGGNGSSGENYKASQTIFSNHQLAQSARLLANRSFQILRILQFDNLSAFR